MQQFQPRKAHANTKRRNGTMYMKHREEGTFMPCCRRHFDIFVNKTSFVFSEPATVPHLFVPADLVDSREPVNPVTCSANLGFPPGQLEWHIKQRGKQEHNSNFVCWNGFEYWHHLCCLDFDCYLIT